MHSNFVCGSLILVCKFFLMSLRRWIQKLSTKLYDFIDKKLFTPNPEDGRDGFEEALISGKLFFYIAVPALIFITILR